MNRRAAVAFFLVRRLVHRTVERARSEAEVLRRNGQREGEKQRRAARLKAREDAQRHRAEADDDGHLEVTPATEPRGSASSAPA